MQKLTQQQVKWLYENQPSIAHWIYGIFYDKIVKSDLTAAVDVYLEDEDYNSLPLEFSQVTEQPEQPKRNHWYLLLTILFGVLAITSPFWKDVAGDWFAYITLTGLSSWALIKYYAN